MSDLERTRDIVGGLLTEVSLLFKGRPKITLIVRHPELEAQGKDADFVMTDDSLEGAITVLQRRAALSTTGTAQDQGDRDNA